LPTFQLLASTYETCLDGAARHQIANHVVDHDFPCLACFCLLGCSNYSSDEEEAALRKDKEECKRKETMVCASSPFVQASDRSLSF